MASVAPPANPAVTEPDPLRWKALGVVLVASFMILLDVSIVNVAIPSIRNSIKASFTQIEWVLAGYQLSYAVTLITGGRLGDIFGRKRLFIIGVSGFTLASTLCGAASSGEFLIAARVLQGIFAALMYPQVLSVIQVNFPPRERGKAFGLFGAVIGIATITGPLAGGLLIQANVFDGWRPIFLVNIPIGIGAVIAAIVLLKESKAPTASRLDIPGTIILTTALMMIAYPLVEGREAGWPLWTFGLMIGAVPVLGAFWMYNTWRAKGAGSPLVEPALFTDRSFVAGLLVMATFISGIPAFFLTFSIFLQAGHGLSALQTGLTTLPFSIASAFASGFSIRLAPKIGKRILSLGCVLLVIGMCSVLATLNIVGEGNFAGWYLIPALAISGLGMGCVIAPLANIVLGGIHHGNAGSASGVLTTVQQVGGAMGVAIVGVIFFGLLTSHSTQIAGDRSSDFQAKLVRAGGTFLPTAAVPAIDSGFSQCFRDRAAASDPSAEPESCATLRINSEPPASASAAELAARAQVAQVIQDEATARRAATFTYAFQHAVLYNLVAWTLTFLFIILLPNPKPREVAGAAGGGH